MFARSYRANVGLVSPSTPGANCEPPLQRQPAVHRMPRSLLSVFIPFDHRYAVSQSAERQLNLKQTSTAQPSSTSDEPPSTSHPQTATSPRPLRNPSRPQRHPRRYTSPPPPDAYSPRQYDALLPPNVPHVPCRNLSLITENSHLGTGLVHATFVRQKIRTPKNQTAPEGLDAPRIIETGGNTKIFIEPACDIAGKS
jgi:hypothetical protein